VQDSPSRPQLGAPQNASDFRPGVSILEQIGTPDYSGWMRKKGERYGSWRYRFFVLKGVHLYCLRNNNKSVSSHLTRVCCCAHVDSQETKIKGYVNLTGYKVVVDENLDPGRYGFKIVHDADKTHYFSSDEQPIIRDWMKAIMKTSIERDYSRAWFVE
jgi:hypothetical protein